MNAVDKFKSRARRLESVVVEELVVVTLLVGDGKEDELRWAKAFYTKTGTLLAVADLVVKSDFEREWISQ